LNAKNAEESQRNRRGIAEKLLYAPLRFYAYSTVKLLSATAEGLSDRVAEALT